MNNSLLTKDLYRLGSALSEINRIKIILSLLKIELTASEIYKKNKLPQNLASHHLHKLLNLKVIKCRKEGRYIYYSLNPQEIKYLTSQIRNFLISNKNA